VIKYAILCTYASGTQRIVSSYLEDSEDAFPEEFLEQLQLCNPDCYYEVVLVKIAHIRKDNAYQLPVQQALPSSILECPVG
jgi:hypothetical protein